MVEQEREDKLLVLDVVRRTTEALTRLVDAVKGIGGNGRLEGHDGEKGRVGDGERRR